MSRVPARSGLLRFVLAFAATVGVGIGLIALSNLARLDQQEGATRPPVPHTIAYSVEYRERPGGEWHLIRISEQGAECHTFDASPRLYTACNLAVNSDPAIIAADARGRLNTEDTAAFEAVVWRARMSEGAGFCAAAGLLDAYLDRCESAAKAPEYVVADATLEIRVPAGS